MSSIGGTEYSIQEAKFMPGLVGNRLEMTINIAKRIINVILFYQQCKAYFAKELTERLGLQICKIIELLIIYM